MTRPLPRGTALRFLTALSALLSAGCNACGPSTHTVEEDVAPRVRSTTRRGARGGTLRPSLPRARTTSTRWTRIALSPAEVRGRNTWIVWSGGDDLFWDGISKTSLGTLDFLKTLSSHPSLPAGRGNRWAYLGLVNEPCSSRRRARPAALRPVARQASRRLPARPVRGREEVPGREDRGARKEHAGRLVLRRRQRHRRPAALPESRLRRGGRATVGREAVLRGRDVLRVEGPREAVPGGNDVRVLPRRARARRTRRPTPRTRAGRT